LKLYKNFGFTLIELMIVISIIGTLAGIAVPTYVNYIQRTVILRCITEIRLIEKELLAYMSENDTLPENLDDIGLGDLRDPWGNPYEYLRSEDTKKGGEREERKENRGKIIFWSLLIRTLISTVKGRMAKALLLLRLKPAGMILSGQITASM